MREIAHRPRANASVEMDAAGLPLRSFLVTAACGFVIGAAKLPGIIRIAMLGSLLTTKTNPKDADLLITVEDEADLAKLASAARKLKGRAQTRKRGADIFLANGSSSYLGRICHWRECARGVRMACKAQHCGRREFLHDDLHVLNLAPSLVASPPLELWPHVVRRVELPPDVEELLLLPLAGSRIEGK